VARLAANCARLQAPMRNGARKRKTIWPIDLEPASYDFPVHGQLSNSSVGIVSGLWLYLQLRQDCEALDEVARLGPWPGPESRSRSRVTVR
jgi:hypothetical protein